MKRTRGSKKEPQRKGCVCLGSRGNRIQSTLPGCGAQGPDHQIKPSSSPASTQDNHFLQFISRRFRFQRKETAHKFTLETLSSVKLGRFRFANLNQTQCTEIPQRWPGCRLGFGNPKKHE